MVYALSTAADLQPWCPVPIIYDPILPSLLEEESARSLDKQSRRHLRIVPEISEPIKKIDFHCHTTNRRLPNAISPSATLDTIAEKMAEHDLEKTVVLASYFPHRNSGISNFRLYHWIRNRPEFLMFGSLDFQHYFFQGYNELEELANMRALSGIKIYTCYQQIDLNSEKMLKVEELANEYRLPLLFHVGGSYQARRTTGKLTIANLVTPKDVKKVAERNPDLEIIIAHMGKPFFEELFEAINETPNLYADMSGLIDSKHNPDERSDGVREVREFVSKCGSSRLLFGTDFPVMSHEDAIYFIEQAGLSREQRENIYYNNAWKILRR